MTDQQRQGIVLCHTGTVLDFTTLCVVCDVLSTSMLEDTSVCVCGVTRTTDAACSNSNGLS